MRRTVTALALLLGLLTAGNVARAQDFDAEGEAAMLDRINALRVEHQLAPLARLDTLDAVARAHSTEMAGAGALTHVSERTGSPEDRVRAAGVETVSLSENVALHRDAALAQEALVASPPHLGNMLSPSVTHAGIGAVRTERGIYVTQVFAELAPPPAPVVADEELPLPDVAPAAEPVDAAPVFGIIPPFVERLAEQAVALPQAVAEQASGVEPSEPGAEQASGVAPIAPAEAPAITEAPAIPEEPAATPAAPGMQSALRQLVDLAQSLLRPAPAAQ